MTAIEKLISLAGSEENLGNLVGVKQQNISKWKLKKRVPLKKVKKCVAIAAEIFKKKISPSDLNPDYNKYF